MDLNPVIAAVQAAGKPLLDRFRAAAVPDTLAGIVAAIDANDAASLAMLRPALEQARPQARWAEDELAAGALPAGEWWVTDPVEGNINHVHGTTEWAVTATLVRDNQPVLTAVHLPLTGQTYAATAGGGATLDGVPLRVSDKTSLDAALVGTGQARPGEDPEALRRMGRSVAAMLESALVTRVSVPATLPLLQVAAGRMDVFWQHSRVRSGLMAGALLVAEAGGTVTGGDGEPWGPASADFVAAAPGVHAATLAVLAGTR
ncbi:inositol monophosphatase family protein [Actinoplanes sp. NPDC049548]|uniref:inositol monophosphatase family protein n=1 Tax=Actinoplanes sp. NPDC049548 TaxID=3155152 RepID=UPI00342E07E5